MKNSQKYLPIIYYYIITGVIGISIVTIGIVTNVSIKLFHFKPPRPTMGPKSQFNRDQQIALLNNAVKGLGTNEKLLIDVLGSLNSAQRQEIKRSYMARYRKVSDNEDMCAINDGLVQNHSPASSNHYFSLKICCFAKFWKVGTDGQTPHAYIVIKQF